MKNIFVVIALGLLAVACGNKSNSKSSENKAGIKFMSFEEMNKLQKIKPKKVVVDVYTDWCGWCKVMDQKTFTHKEISKYVNKNYYAVKLDAESSEKVLYKGEVLTSAELASRVWGVSGYPTTVYLDENLSPIVQPISGYLDTTAFNKIVHFFGENAYKTTSFESYTVPADK